MLISVCLCGGNTMIENIFVGIMVICAVAAGIWGWFLEHGGDKENTKKMGEKDSENRESRV